MVDYILMTSGQEYHFTTEVDARAAWDAVRQHDRNVSLVKEEMIPHRTTLLPESKKKSKPTVHWGNGDEGGWYISEWPT